MNRSDYVHFMRLKKNYKLGNISIEDSEKSNEKENWRRKNSSINFRTIYKKILKEKGFFLIKNLLIIQHLKKVIIQIILIY